MCEVDTAPPSECHFEFKLHSCIATSRKQRRQSPRDHQFRLLTEINMKFASACPDSNFFAFGKADLLISLHSGGAGASRMLANVCSPVNAALISSS
jgi:hypothetical protein